MTIHRRLKAAWLSLEEAREQPSSHFSTLVQWLEDYIMSAHPELGRNGAVCPYTRIAKKCGALRFHLSMIQPDQETAAADLVRRALSELAWIPVAAGDEQLRVIIMAFPGCESPEGIAMLHRVLKQLRLNAMVRLRMMGFMHAHAEAGGLWNPDFRPLQAPLPLLVVRHLVETDAPFISRQHVQWVPYLLRFGLRGVSRLKSYRKYASRRLEKI